MSDTLALSFQAPAPARRKAHARRLKLSGLSSAVERSDVPNRNPAVMAIDADASCRFQDPLTPLHDSQNSSAKA
jgi:hypothetical protein